MRLASVHIPTWLKSKSGYVKKMYSLILEKLIFYYITYIVYSNKSNKTSLYIHDYVYLNKYVYKCQTFIKIVKNVNI